MKHKIAVAAALIGVITVTAGVLYARRGAVAPQVVTETAARGTIVSAIAATGTLQAVTTVEVGTQVSGTVQALYADFNSIVRKGQVLARLDPSLYQSAIEQAQANLARTEADLERLRVAAGDADSRLQRARELAARQLIPAADLDAADVAVRSAQAQVHSAQAQVTQSRASLTQAQVNLDKTVISSPIDGIVISRNVDIGQTVAASLQAPTLYRIAADLTRMQLKASIDESDLGRIASGQAVTFNVDAFPGETFSGAVDQIRLNPTVESNVVTYAAIISAPNPGLKLKPGMTANLTVVVAQRDNVVRVPAAALRFRPSDDVLSALGVSVPAAQRQGSILWQRVGTSIEPVRVRTGITDGTYTEVVDGLAAGAEVVTRVTTTSEPTASASAGARRSTNGNPLVQSGPPGPPPPR
jgi:HlyD family secretion protein